MLDDRQALAAYVESAIHVAPDGMTFDLAYGERADFYVDMRAAVLTDSQAMSLAVAELYRILPQEVQAIGGVPTAGLMLMGGLLLYCHQKDSSEDPRVGFYTRSAAKTHGTNRQLEGNPTGIACLVEDTVTTGGSLVEHIGIARDHGVDVRHALALFDREEGGREALERIGVQLHTVFQRRDFAL